MAQMIGVTEEALREKLAEIMESPKLGEAIAQANQAMAGMAAQAGEEIRFDPAAQAPAEEVGDEIRAHNWFRKADGTPAEAEPAPSDPGGGDINPDTGLRTYYNPREDEPLINTDPAHWETDGILTEANLIVNGSRANDYGENSLPRIAQYWSTYLGKDVTGRDVANLMILLKVAREGHKHKRDNYVDICGYAAMGEATSD
jgi:hypothetical protein